MKVIALLPFKNEEWCLPSYLYNTTKIVDEIIAIDDGSTDNSVKILEDAGAKVYSSEKLKIGEEIIYNKNKIGKIIIDKPYPFALIKVVDPNLEEFENKELFSNKKKCKILKSI